MASSEIAKYKIEDVRRQSESDPNGQANLQKEHYLLQYTFGTKKENSRIIRKEEGGKYYDYLTKKTYSSLKSLEKALGITRNGDPEAFGTTDFFKNSASRRQNSLPLQPSPPSQLNQIGYLGAIFQPETSRVTIPFKPGFNPSDATNTSASRRSVSMVGGIITMPEVIVTPKKVSAHDQAMKLAGTIAKESKSLFDYYYDCTAAGSIHCASFAFHTLSTLAEKHGRKFAENVTSTWGIDKLLRDRAQFKCLNLEGRQIADDPSFRKMLVDAPVGTIVTLRYVGTTHTEVSEDRPTHTIISLGGGLYIHNTSDKAASLVDFSSARTYPFKGEGQDLIHGGVVDGYESFASSFIVVKNSGMYVPIFSDFAFATEKQSITPADVGIANSKKARRLLQSGRISAKPNQVITTPDAFAAALRQKYNMPYEDALNAILTQNKISASSYQSLKSGMAIEISLPSDKVKRNTFITAQKTPGMEKISARVSSASFGTSSTAAESTAIRARDFFRREKYIWSFGPTLRIPEENFGPLSVILYNEKFSSTGASDDRENSKNAAFHLFGDAGIGVKIPGLGNARLHSFGEYQVNVDRTVQHLDDPEKRQRFKEAMAARGELSREIDIGQVTFFERSWEALTTLFSSKKAATTLSDCLEKWDDLSPEQKRTATALILHEVYASSLYIGNQFYTENKSLLNESIKRNWGSSFNQNDLELTAVFSYNRGLPSTYAGVFQQNLLSVADHKGITPKGGEGEFRITGVIGDSKDEKSENGAKTRALFKKVCEAYGIRNISVRTDLTLLDPSEVSNYKPSEIKTYSISELAGNAKLFLSVFGRYSNSSAFFHKKEFSEAQTFPCLNFEYLGSKQEYLTDYLSNYYFFNSSVSSSPPASSSLLASR